MQRSEVVYVADSGSSILGIDARGDGPDSHGSDEFVTATWAILYMTAGSASIEVAGLRATLQPGSLLFAPPGRVRVRVSPDHALLGLAIREQGNSPSSPLRAFSAPLLRVVPEVDRPEWEGTMRELVRRTSIGRVGPLDILSLKERFARYFWLRDSFETRRVVHATFRMLWSHLDRHVSLAELAKEIGYTRGHLNDLIRSSTGVSLSAWVCGIRMAHARALLAETDEAIATVGMMAGYADPAYFARKFRAASGVTPQIWRVAHRPNHPRFHQVAMPKSRAKEMKQTEQLQAAGSF